MNLKRAGLILTGISGIIVGLVLIPTNPVHSSNYLRQILAPQKGNSQYLKALFTPQDNIRKTLTGLIGQEQQEICVAVYYLTDPKIAQALLEAANRNIHITIITEPKHVLECEHSQIFNLKHPNIQRYVFQHHQDMGIMHHKFMILTKNLDGQSIVATGSFNYTRSAQKYNQENVIITNDPATVMRYQKQFSYLQNSAQAITDFLFANRFHPVNKVRKHK